ncbi:lipopolysaccharide assembly protein LapB [Marinobacterium jannaschii]|uniref:lipopolysaccharide assembly protein LapB n=1 Tax=Marinobacterium jannaschii TaxID=64970 RepID=UPI00056A6B02|nr:lipopolysaccharide assembly protein LapB [Marinobacterium jannaschii]
MLPEVQNYLLIIPLFLAVAAGWWLGRRDQRRKQLAVRPRTDMSREYFAGLDYLLNERTDEAIESFIRALEVNSDTIPAHLALAKLFRRKGDVDRAIQIHQNLLARPDLKRSEFLRVQMALARDYDAVGLLDRAENLLLELLKQSLPKDTAENARKLLIRIYEKEGEWQQALDTAVQMSAEERKSLKGSLAHYCCELSEVARANGDLAEARRCLKQADGFDNSVFRVALLKAKIAIGQSQWRQAIRYLKQGIEREPVFISEAVPLLKECYQALGNSAELVNYLRQCMTETASTTVMLALAEDLAEERGPYVAGSYITEELKKRPSVKGFNRLIDLHINYGAESARDSLRVLRGLTGQLEYSKPVYRCHQCGYSGKLLHWHCPSCRRWGTTKPIQGLEGE